MRCPQPTRPQWSIIVSDACALPDNRRRGWRNNPADRRLCALFRIPPHGEREANVECPARVVPPARRCLIRIVASCEELRLPPCAFAKQKRGWVQAVSPVRDGSVVAEAATAGGFWTIRVGKRKSARTALAANRAATLRRIGLRRIRSRRPRAAIRLAVRSFHPKRHVQNSHACENAESAAHFSISLCTTSAGATPVRS